MEIIRRKRSLVKISGISVLITIFLIIFLIIFLKYNFVIQIVSSNKYSMLIKQIFWLVISLLIIVVSLGLIENFEEKKFDELKEPEYLANGYENQLKSYLKGSYKTILLNGAFGTGKTTMLWHVLKCPEFSGKKY